MTGVYIDVTERRKAEEHKNLLIAELDHRVKNVLACVAAVAQSSRESSRSADEFIDALNDRINSLSNTHALLSRSHWQGVDLGELVRSELAFCTRDDSALIEGPHVDLAAEATQPVAIVLHELATNAAKYGALANGHGRVIVRWRRQANGSSDGKLVLEWRETGGPPLAASNAPGFGTSVIRDLMPYELGGAVDYELAREGARCRLQIPANGRAGTLRHAVLSPNSGRVLCRDATASWYSSAVFQVMHESFAVIDEAMILKSVLVKEILLHRVEVRRASRREVINDHIQPSSTCGARWCRSKPRPGEASLSDGKCPSGTAKELSE